MRREVVFMMLFLTAFGLTYLFLLTPETSAEYNYFPFHVQKMTFRSYLYYLCERVRWLIILGFFSFTAKEYKRYLDAFFAMWVAYIADYCLIYHAPAFWAWGVAVSYSLVMAVGMALLTIFAIINEIWKSNQ